METARSLDPELDQPEELSNLWTLPALSIRV